MLPSRSDNRKSALTVNVKFPLISFTAALLFAGMFAIATATPPSNNSAKGQQATSASTGSNFLASLRFWEKSKTPQHNHPQVPANNVRPREIPPKAPNTPVESVVQATGTAPEPPPVPYVESRNGPGVTLLPEWSDSFYNTNEKEALPMQEIGQFGQTSHVSYSFDTRDWIESFPAQQDIRESTMPTIQAASLHAAVLPPPASQSDRGENGYWDGHATKLATITAIREDINKLQDHQTVVPQDQFGGVPAPPNVIPREVPQIDLSPSYEKRLPHVQTCGVVVVQANFPLTEIASILDEIDQLQDDLTSYIGVPAAQEKIELCLFANEKSYIEFLKEFFPRAPDDRRALFVKLENKPGTLMVQKSKNFEIDLRHEMTHAIIHASIPRVPIWLDEGLAKYFEVPPHERAAHHSYMSHIRNGTRFGMVPSLDRLTKLETIDDMGVKEYRESWAWTHFLIHHSPQTHRLLAGYLQMLAQYPETGGDYASTESESVLSKYIGLGTNIARGREKSAPIPSLKLYLDDVMSNQRKAFQDHFGTMEK